MAKLPSLDPLPNALKHGDYGHVCWPGCEIYGFTSYRAKLITRGRWPLQPLSFLWTHCKHHPVHEKDCIQCIDLQVQEADDVITGLLQLVDDLEETIDNYDQAYRGATNG